MARIFAELPAHVACAFSCAHSSGLPEGAALCCGCHQGDVAGLWCCGFAQRTGLRQSRHGPLYCTCSLKDMSSASHSCKSFAVSSRAKAKRKMEADLAKVKGLGEAKPEVDDVAAWVAASREAEAEAKRRAEKEKAAKVASMYDEEVRMPECLPVSPLEANFPL